MDIAELGLKVDSKPTDRAGKSLDGFSKSASKAERMAEKYTGASKHVAAANDNAAKSARRSASALTNLKGKYVGLASSITAVVTALTVLTRTSFEFRDALAEVSTLVDTATFDMAGLEAAAIKQSKVFGGSATSQVKAFYNLISGGAKSAAEANTLLTAANRLAVGGVTDVTTASNGLLAVMNSYDLSAKEATNISDALFVAMKAGQTTIGKLASGIGSVAPLAAKLNISYDELLATVSALTKASGNTNTAFTGTRAILAAILKPTAEAKKLAKELKLEFNAAGLASKGMSGFIADLVDKTGGSSEAIATLFGGVEALVPVMQLAGAAGVALNENLFAMGKKAFETKVAFDKMANSPGFQSGRLWAAVSAEAAKLGNTIAQKLTPAMKYLADNMSTIVNVLKVVAVGFATAFSPAIISGVVGLTTAIGVGLVGAVKALTVAMIANPLGALIVAITTAITAVYLFRDKIKQAIGVDVIEITKVAANAIVGSFVGAYKSTIAVWKNLPTAFADLALQATNGMIHGLEIMINKSIEGINSLLKMMNNIPGVKIDGLGKIDLGRIENSYSGAATNVAGKIREEFQKAMSANYFGGAGLSANIDPARFGDPLSGDKTKTGQKMAETLKTIKTHAVAAGGALAGAGKAAKDAWDGLSGPVIQTANAMEERINPVAQTLKSTFSSWIDSAVNGTFKLKDALKGLAAQLIKIVANKAISSMFSVGSFGGGGSGGGNFLGTLVSAIPKLFGFEGGGYTGNGPRTGGVDGRGGFPAIVHPRETIIDHTKGASPSGGGVINQTFVFDGAISADDVMRMAEQGSQKAVETVKRSLPGWSENINRNGALA